MALLCSETSPRPRSACFAPALPPACCYTMVASLLKTRQFKDARYVGDPLNAVKIFNEKEVDELMVLDIDATVQSRGPDLAMLKGLAVESRMPRVTGVASAPLNRKPPGIVPSGSRKSLVSSAALARPELIREMADAVGGQSVVVTLDVRKNRLMPGYTVFTHNGCEKHKGPTCSISAARHKTWVPVKSSSTPSTGMARCKGMTCIWPRLFGRRCGVRSH